MWGFPLVANKQAPVSHWPGGCCHWWARHAQVLLCVDVFASLGNVGLFTCSKHTGPSVSLAGWLLSLVGNPSPGFALCCRVCFVGECVTFLGI